MAKRVAALLVTAGLFFASNIVTAYAAPPDELAITGEQDLADYIADYEEFQGNAANESQIPVVGFIVAKEITSGPVTSHTSGPGQITRAGSVSPKTEDNSDELYLWLMVVLSGMCLLLLAMPDQNQNEKKKNA